MVNEVRRSMVTLQTLVRLKSRKHIIHKEKKRVLQTPLKKGVTEHSEGITEQKKKKSKNTKK